MKDVVFGLIGGALGALLWAGVVYVTEYEIGWIAWAIGGLVGFSVALGNKDRGRSPMAAGSLAVIITTLSIVAGKYAAVEMLLPSDAEIIEAYTESFDTSSPSWLMMSLPSSSPWVALSFGRKGLIRPAPQRSRIIRPTYGRRQTERGPE